MGPDRFRVTKVSNELVWGVCTHTQDSAAEVWAVGATDWFVDDDLELIERAPSAEPSPRPWENAIDALEDARDRCLAYADECEVAWLRDESRASAKEYDAAIEVLRASPQAFNALHK